MKNKKLPLFVLFLLLFSFKVSASDVCSTKGYTVVNINGIFTNEQEAILNKKKLKEILPQTFNSQPVIVDYIYNSTHLAGAGDIFDAVNQGFFNSKSDFDLVEMLDDASKKITTQKLLLIGYSQGNFYANNFYDKVANKDGGLPISSIGVYGIATPTDHIAGNGQYLTSDSDKVISTLFNSVKNIMTPNTHIELQDKNNNGHSFTDVYLKYRGNQIVSDIKSSLSKLSSNQIQNTQNPCISPQEISLGHKINKVVLGATDFVVNNLVKAEVFVFNKITGTVKSIASLLGNTSNKNLASAGAFNSENTSEVSNQTILNDNIPVEIIKDTETPTQSTSEEATENTNTDDNTEDNSEIYNPNTIENTPPDVNTNENSNVIVNGSSDGGGGGGSTVNNNTSGDSNSDNSNNVDIIPPSITLSGEDILNINLGTTYVDAGATALDENDGVVEVITSGIVDTATIGTYTLTYTAKDIALNISTKSRTVNVVKNETSDIIAPVITLTGESIITIPLNSIYVDLGATALDETDGIITVVMTGVVDTTNIGTYIITYTATDIANNISTVTRTINVNNTNPVISTVATLSLPNAGTYAGDGLEPSRGRKNLTPFTFQVIYTDSNNNAPKDVKLHVKNLTTEISLPEVVMNKISKGTDILSDGNYANGELYTFSSVYDLGDYNYYFTASDINENIAKTEDDNLLRFSTINSSYTYLPKYTFGLNNGDEKDWQVWSFNGSNVYDWSDTYLDNYLREQFKIQTYPGGYWCSQCLQRGIFNHDPQKGFETSDISLSSLEGNPQNSMTGQIFNVTIQWDSTGYSYTISHDSVVDSTGHTDVANMNNDLWVGWDGSFNNFTTFPSGSWQGIVPYSPMDRIGGGSMILQPYPVYNSNSVPDPNIEPEPDPTPILSSEKLITTFNFEGLTPNVIGEINNTDNTIKLTVPYDTVITSLSPTIIVSEKSSVLPANSTVQDFTNPVTYTVKAEDDSTLMYVVTVIVSPNPNPDPDSILPTITSYTFDGAQNSIITNPIINNLSIVLNSSKNVNWMSIKIVKEDDSSLYRMFQSGSGCVDGTNICTKVWDGILSSGGLLQNGNYKVKIHMKDNKNNEYEDYLPSVITINNQ